MDKLKNKLYKQILINKKLIFYQIYNIPEELTVIIAFKSMIKFLYQEDTQKKIIISNKQKSLILLMEVRKQKNLSSLNKIEFMIIQFFIYEIVFYFIC